MQWLLARIQLVFAVQIAQIAQMEKWIGRTNREGHNLKS